MDWEKLGGQSEVELVGTGPGFSLLLWEKWGGTLERDSGSSRLQHRQSLSTLGPSKWYVLSSFIQTLSRWAVREGAGWAQGLDSVFQFEGLSSTEDGQANILFLVVGVSVSRVGPTGREQIRE